MFSDDCESDDENMGEYTHNDGLVGQDEAVGMEGIYGNGRRFRLWK